MYLRVYRYLQMDLEYFPENQGPLHTPSRPRDVPPGFQVRILEETWFKVQVVAQGSSIECLLVSPPWGWENAAGKVWKFTSGLPCLGRSHHQPLESGISCLNGQVVSGLFPLDKTHVK